MSFEVPFQEAIDFHKSKVKLPSKTYKDLVGRAHDRAFVVAGAEKQGLLEDIHKALGDALQKGETLAQFGSKFDEAVAKYGWTDWTGEKTAQGRAWRKEVIYQTNIKTAYAAGQYKQMTDPDVTSAYPYWRYRHAYYGTPERPRFSHQALNGIVKRFDDPFWRTHYPPNGWNCHCGIEQVAEDELSAQDKHSLKAAAPHVPIDPNWSHAPGKSWAEGLVPKELQTPLQPLSSSALKNEKLNNLPPLESVSKPSRLKSDPNKDPIDQFLNHFGAKQGANGAVAFRDAFGETVIISDQLFYRPDGSPKIDKGKRADDIMSAAEALADPDEIWVDFYRSENAPINSKPELRKRYIRWDGDKGAAAVFEYGKSGWEAKTTFTSDNRRPNRRLSYLDNIRHGALLFRRQKD